MSSSPTLPSTASHGEHPDLKETHDHDADHESFRRAQNCDNQCINAFTPQSSHFRLIVAMDSLVHQLVVSFGDSGEAHGRNGTGLTTRDQDTVCSSTVYVIINS